MSKIFKGKSFALILLVCFLMVFFMISSLALADPGDTTFIIPIKGDIDNGLVQFVKTSYTDAISQGAGAIIFEIDTYGGLVDSAIEMKDLIMSSQVPTVCFVDKKAISAGALIALSGEKLVMRPGTTLGAAEPRAGSEKADEKTVSMWTSQLSAVAEARGRNGLIAAAMSDSDIAIEGVIEKGKLLTLGDKQALNLGMIDAVLDTREEIIRDFHLPSTVVEIDPSFKQQAVQWLSSPYIASILLTIGIAGIVIEIFTAGFGVFGAVGMISFLAFFIGNFWAGNAGLGAILLFLLGAFLIIMEIFVIPGFGVPGVLGIASILFSIIFASPDIQYAAISIVIALAGSIVLIAISLKNRRTRKLWSKIILSQKQENKEGYSSQNLVQENLLGCYGLAVTPLRPAGTAIFDNKRIDVVTEGEFLDKDTPIEVIEVSGGRVVVKRKS